MMDTQTGQPASMVNYIFETYVQMLQDLNYKLFCQILAFADKAPSDGFINDLIGNMANGFNTASFTATVNSFMEHCDIETMAYNFTDEAIAMKNTIDEISRINKSIEFINRSKDAIEAIVKTTICYN